jgi:TonB family protein
MHEAMKGGGTEAETFGGPTGRQSPGMGGGGGGGGQGYLGGAVQMLTPTEGVDFNAYIARVLASVKRNWYSVMPESARLGDQGKVVLQFRIMKNGVVPDAEPVMMGSSGKEPLDRAAASSIRASTPFEPLPTAFSGPYIELRFIFLYNIPLNSQTAQ